MLEITAAGNAFPFAHRFTGTAGRAPASRFRGWFRRLVRTGLPAFALLAAGWAGPANADEPAGEVAALAGLSSVKAVFLVNRDSAAATARYLKGIQATLGQIAGEGVETSAVLVFLGKPVQFITTEPAEKIAAEHKEELASIAQSVAALQALGVRMEVCTAATRHFGVDDATLLPGMLPVANGLVSMIGWQSRGYVPMTF